MVKLEILIKSIANREIERIPKVFDGLLDTPDSFLFFVLENRAICNKTSQNKANKIG